MSANLIVHCSCHDIDDYKNYAKAAAKAVFTFNGKFLVTDKEQQIKKETGEHPKTVIVEFDTLEQAKACY